MEKIHELFTLSDIMGSKGGWFYNSDFGNLFYQLFRELPSVRMVKFKVVFATSYYSIFCEL